MAELQRITITVAGRNYPMNVSPEEEEGLRRVGKEIERMVKVFEVEYAVKDKQDALAMCALSLGADAERNKINAGKERNETKRRLDEINLLLNKEIEEL